MDDAYEIVMTLYTDYVEIGSFQEIRLRAAEGCHLCNIIVCAIQNSKVDSCLAPDDTIALGNIPDPADSKGLISIKMSNRPDEKKCAVSWSNQYPGLPILPYDPKYSSSDEHFGDWIAEHIDRWLQDCTCQQGHSASVQADIRYPKRLIQIHDAQHISLIETNDLEVNDFSVKPKYATVSHCWGNGDFIKLKQSTLLQWKTSIPFTRLNKKFKQLISLVHKLDIKHVWIDTLCIIQDSVEDWAQESSYMGSIYQNAILNLAPISKSEKDPCFESCNLLGFYPCRIGPYPTWIYGSHDALNAQFPLLERGWVLQEKLLAARMVYLGARVLIWDCVCGRETDRKAMGLEMSLPQSSFLTMARRGQAWDQLPTGFFLDMWLSIIVYYTACDLTFPTDKLVALAAVARAFQKMSSLTYVGGMWTELLGTKQLLWEVRLPVGRRLKPRPPFRGAPTWSWASTDETVSILPTGQYVMNTKLIEIAVEAGPLSHCIFGYVACAMIKITGRWSDFSIRKDDDDSHSMSCSAYAWTINKEQLEHDRSRVLRSTCLCRIIDASDYGFRFKYVFGNLTPDIMITDETIRFFMTAWAVVPPDEGLQQSNDYMFRTCGLMLTKSLAKSDVYERLGIFETVHSLSPSSKESAEFLRWWDESQEPDIVAIC